MSEQNKLKTSDTVTTQGQSSFHSYTADETEAFAEFINGQLQNDEHLANKLPLKEPAELFEAVKDGVLLCKLVNKAKPGTIDERVLNVKDKLNPWQVSENHQLFINSAKSIGCQVVNCGPNDLSAGTAHITLGVVWQVIKIALLQDINLKEHPELVRLLEDGETLEDLLKLPAEQLLIRWVNYHLKNAESERRISNFSGDVKDSEIYTILLNQISQQKCGLGPLEETEDMKARAELMLKETEKIDCREFITSRDVVKGNSKLNLAFTANLFNNYPALEEINEDDYDFADLLDLDGEGSREERAFRFWIQSLNIEYIEENYALQNLYADLKDGIVLLTVLDSIVPGVVNWKRVKKNPKNKFHAVGNCNEYIRCAKECGFSTVNCGGTDILDGNKKLILGQTWQLMRLSILELLKQVGGNDLDGNNKVDEKDLIMWVNNQLSLDPPMKSFKDKRIGTGKLLCDLCAAVAPKSVDKEFITEGGSDEEAEQNAKYAISVARKLGGVVFLLWEDIVEINPKMCLTFVAALMLIANGSN